MKETNLIYGENCPYIEFDLDDDTITISTAVLRLLGLPDKVRLWKNVRERHLLIEPVNMDDPNGLEVDDNQPIIRCSFVLTMDMFYEEKVKGLRYRIVAKHNAASNVAIFEMKNAVIYDL